MGNQPLHVFDLRGKHSIRYFLRVGTRVCIKSEEERKCQESIQLVSHLTQNALWESDKRRKRHIQKRLEGQLRLRAVAVYSKWSDGGNHRVPKARKGGEH